LIGQHKYRASDREVRRGDDAVMSNDIARLLQEVAETHHRVFRITDGVDPDWASWYADWLLHLSELPELLGTTPVRSELVFALVQLDKEYTAQPSDGPWPSYYAHERVRRFPPAS
jgi:hypothetical protein